MRRFGRYQALFESSADGIVIVSLEGQIHWANKAYADMVGYTRQELRKMNYQQLTPQKWHQMEERIVHNSIIPKGHTEVYEKEYQKKNGSVFPISIRVTLIKDKDGQPTALGAIVRDLTEKERLRQILLKARIHAQEEEGRRLAHELHDEVCQVLASLSLEMSSIIKCSEQLSEPVLDLLKRFEIKVDSVAESIRHFGRRLRPDILDNLGLIPALEWLVEDLNRENVMRASVMTSGSERRLPPEVELVLFRITQESLRNARQHSQATEVLVKVAFGSAWIELSIRDNGIGFDVPAHLREFAYKGKLGLLGMKERISAVDGKFSIDSKVGEGTKIIAKVRASVVPQ